MLLITLRSYTGGIKITNGHLRGDFNKKTFLFDGSLEDIKVKHHRRRQAEERVRQLRRRRTHTTNGLPAVGSV